MFQTIASYWPHILAVLSFVLGGIAVIHAAMTKEDVRAAIGWVGVIMLSPLIGAAIYLVAGVNRMRRRQIISRRRRRGVDFRELLTHLSEGESYIERFGSRMASLKRLGDTVTRTPLLPGNRVELLSTGDETYAAFIAAIDAAERSILLETYIFDNDEIGRRIAGRLIAAVRRGVEVRVLIDAVGARYTVPSIRGLLEDGGVPVAVFNGSVIVGLRLPYANLRTHRKILVVDRRVAFAGGMNIRDAFTGPDAAHDTHFRVTGPVVSDLFAVAAGDWNFETGEVLKGAHWTGQPQPVDHGDGALVRPVISGPDASLETNHSLMMGAFSVAELSIRIMSPYFLPDAAFLAALATAARRGVEVDIVVPSKNNLAIVAHAMMGQFGAVLRDGCRVFQATGPFDHSKLMVVDGCWSFVGSSNLDSRSLRLNFEIDLEIHDERFAEGIERRVLAARDAAHELTRDEIVGRPFLLRLLDRILWLGSPYL
ncbi:phospholipase D-like domain-containing protein [Rhizobium halophytocola]|uniref:Phospholipase D n=1 Tax=Rhizobium halophytocola TaxID=735519 RepID=A0ABS4E308_9HYPH|nr:phospholipase D-like domain-containing protein [Rhizobium halophytocola]MBP1852324.1 cardiolipin synthase [Rhizobium halophytocola]